MATKPRILENGQVEVGITPQDIGTSASAGDWCSLANYNHVDVVVFSGARNGACAMTFDKATAVSGGTTTLAFDQVWEKTGQSATSWTKTAVTSNSHNISTTNNTITVVGFDADDLGDTYDYFQVDLGAPASATNLICVAYIFSEPRFASDDPVDAIT